MRKYPWLMFILVGIWLFSWPASVPAQGGPVGRRPRVTHTSRKSNVTRRKYLSGKSRMTPKKTASKNLSSVSLSQTVLSSRAAFRENVSPQVVRTATTSFPIYRVPQQLRLGQELALDRGRFPNKEKIDAVIFDMDGTLLDSIPAWDHAAAKYLRTCGIELPEEIQEYVKHISLLEGARYIKEKLNLPGDPHVLVEGTLSVVRGRYLYEVPAKPGVEELLKTLHAQGIKICVATASDPTLARGAFERLGLLQYMDFIIGCDEVGVGKQFPAVYEEALRRLGTSRERTLVVEDALYAVETAKRAGFPTAGVPDPVYSQTQIDKLNATADYFFTSFKDSLK